MTNASNVATASKDVLEASLATMIEKATAGMEQGVSFLSAQLPDVIHQLLMWELVSSLVLALLLLIPLVVTIILVIKWNNLSNVAEAITMIMGAISLYTTIASVFCFMTALKVLIAPKLFLVEFAARLLN